MKEHVPTLDADKRQRYQTQLRRHRKARSSSPLPNGNPWNFREAARELIEEAVDRSKKKAVSVRVIAESLTPYIFTDRILEHLGEVMSNSGKVQLIVWNTHCDHLNELVTRFFFGDDAGAFDVRISRTDKFRHIVRDLILIDNNAYRLEAIRPRNDTQAISDFSPEMRARICFNDPEGGTRIRRYFDLIHNALPKSEIET